MFNKKRPQLSNQTIIASKSFNHKDGERLTLHNRDKWKQYVQIKHYRRRWKKSFSQKMLTTKKTQCRNNPKPPNQNRGNNACAHTHKHTRARN